MKNKLKQHDKIHTIGSFTLIELLVVIAIIAILAGMLLPALNNARQNGYTAKCAGNMKSISTAFIMYADDNNGWGTSFYGQGKGSHTYLAVKYFSDNGYLGNYKMDAFNTTNADTLDIPPIFNCPADKRKQNIAMRISYGTNMNLAGWGSHAPWGRYGQYGKKYYDDGGMQHETVLFRPSTVSNPSKVVYGADVKQGNPFFAKPNWKSHIEGFSGEKFPRHNNRSNVWFIDGHIQAMQKKDLEQAVEDYAYTSATAGIR